MFVIRNMFLKNGYLRKYKKTKTKRVCIQAHLFVIDSNKHTVNIRMMNSFIT